MSSNHRALQLRRQLVIFEPSAVWRHWLERLALRAPGIDLAFLSSADKLQQSLASIRPDLIVLAYRLPGVDTYSWIGELRRACGAPAYRVVALVSQVDTVGASLARLAGADAVYRKGADEQALGDDLVAWAGSAPRPVGPGPGWQEAVPLFDPLAVVVSEPAEWQQRVVYHFLADLPDKIGLLRSLLDAPAWQVVGEIELFAGECRDAGALRACEYAELLAARVRAGRGLPSVLMAEQFRILDQTTREIVEWLLESERLAR